MDYIKLDKAPVWVLQYPTCSACTVDLDTDGDGWLCPQCVEHSNEAGGLIAGLYWTAYDLLERATRLTVERDRARDLAARLEAQVARVAEAVCEPHECAIWHLRDELDGMSPDAEVTRIEWRYLDGVSE